MDIGELSTECYATSIVVEEERDANFLAAFEAWLNSDASGNTDAGVRVNPYSALKYAPIYQAVQLISSDVARLPLLLYRRGEGTSRTPMWDHPLTDLVNRQPNAQLNAYRFWKRTMQHLLIFGNAYIWKHYSDPLRPNRLSLYHLLPDRTEVVNLPSSTNPLGERMYRTTVGNGGIHKLLNPDEVIHLEGLQDLTDGEGSRGISTVMAAADAIGLGLAQETFASRFFKHGGRVGGILEIPAGMKQTAADRLEDGFRTKYENGKLAFATVLLRDGAKFHESQRSFRDTQLIEANEQQVRMVARFFGIPSSMLNLSDSVSYNSKSEDMGYYLENCLKSHLCSIVNALDEAVLLPNQRRSNHFGFDTSELIRQDYVSRINAHSVAIGAGFMTPDEAREKENLPPRGADDLKDINAPPPVMQAEPEPEAEPSEEADRQRDHMQNRLVYTLTEEARRKAATGKLSRWLLGGLNHFRQRANYLVGSEDLIDEFISHLDYEDITLERVDKACQKFEADHAK